MITTDLKAFSALFNALDVHESQAMANSVFLVQPESFQVEPESGVDNQYLDLKTRADPQRAVAQSMALAQSLSAAGVEVKVFAGQPDLPDGVFPNNAFATVPGRVVVGRMCHRSRRGETRRADIRRWFTDDLGFEVIDLSGLNLVAEMTGPLVIDRARMVGFCGMSQRVDPAGLVAMHKALGLKATLQFDLVDSEYHSNVVLAILGGRACVCHPGSFKDPHVPQLLQSLYPDRYLSLTREEKDHFVANCIALGDNQLFMSARAFSSLSDAHRDLFHRWGFTLHAVDLAELERAGGSLRCMVAEVFL